VNESEEGRERGESKSRIQVGGEESELLTRISQYKFVF